MKCTAVRRLATHGRRIVCLVGEGTEGFSRNYISVDTYTQPGKPNGLATTPRELGLVWEE